MFEGEPAIWTGDKNKHSIARQSLCELELCSAQRLRGIA